MKTIVGILVLASSILGFALFSIYQLDPGNKPGYKKAIETMPIAIGGDFDLIGPNNHIVTQEILKNKLSLVYFGFTNCPDICPTTLQNLANVINQLSSEQQKKVQVLFISVDPERDKPEYLEAYVKNFQGDIIGLTGDQKQIEKITAAYKVVYYKQNDSQDGKNYLINHSSLIYLMKDGKYVEHFSFNANEQDILQEIKKYIY